MESVSIGTVESRIRRKPQNSDCSSHRIRLSHRQCHLVIRGGYGIFFDNYEGREFDNSQNLCPFSNEVNMSQSTGQTGLITTDTLWPVRSPTCSFGPPVPLAPTT